MRRGVWLSLVAGLDPNCRVSVDVDGQITGGNWQGVECGRRIEGLTWGSGVGWVGRVGVRVTSCLKRVVFGRATLAGLNCPRFRAAPMRVAALG